MTQHAEDAAAAALPVEPDAAALSALYDRWSPLVYSVALRSLGSVGDAEDVTQRVFSAAWVSRRTLDDDPGWLIGLTRQEITAVRAPGGLRPEPPTEASALALGGNVRDDTELAGLAERLLVADGISRLTAIPQQVLRLALYDHFTHDQIAERMGLSPDTVKTHLSRSICEIRARLEVFADAR